MAAVGAQISRLDYNNLRKLVNAVLGAGGTNPNTNAPDPTFGYGQTLLSSNVSAGDVITETQWDNLRLDINKAFTHQTGAPAPLPDVAGSINVGATNATPVKFTEIYQAYLAVADNVVLNRGIIAEGTQTPVDPTLVVTKTLTSAWADSVTFTGTVSFASAVAARSFFNSGGTINFTSSRTGGTSSPVNLAAQNTAWTAFLNNKVGTVKFGKDQFYSLTSGGLAQSATPVFLFTADAPFSNNYFRIYANCNVPSNTNGTATFLSFRVEYIDLTVRQNFPSDLIDGTLKCDITETKSNGVLTIASPTYSFAGPMTTTGAVSNLLPTFTLTSNVESVSEGGSVTFTFTSRNYPSGKQYLLELTGITDADLVFPQTTGIKTIATSGNDTLATATYTVNLAADLLTDPGESIIARVTIPADTYQPGDTIPKTVTIVDSSKTPTPTVSITTTTANAVAGEPDWGSYSRVTVTNTGTRALNISSVQINHGANLTDHQSNFPGNPTSNEVIWYQGSIAVGQSGNFDVRFKGSVVGTQTATVTIISDGNDTPGGGPVPGSSKSANVSVVVVASSPGWAATPATINTTYSSDGITPGETPLSTIRIATTTGNATITVTSVTVGPSGALTPVITTDITGQSISPGGTTFREFQIKFTGGLTVGLTTTTITIDGGAAGTKVVNVNITGSASLPGISVSTTSLVAATKKINENATSSFTISNTGSATLNVTNIAFSGQNSNSNYTVAPTSLTIPKGAPPQTVTVTSNRTRIGTDGANVKITITSNAPAPNNTKEVTFTMTSTGLTPSYTATMEGRPAITDVNTVAVGLRGTSFINGFAGAEPSTKYYSYHDQQGKITGGAAGQTVLQLFQASVSGSGALPGGTTDAQGNAPGWGGTPNELQYWDVGLSKAWFFIPIGKTDAGVQQYMQLPGAGGGLAGYVQMEILPNITQTISPAQIEITNIENDNANQPEFVWSATNGYQNAPWDSNGPGNSNYGFSGTYTGVGGVLEAGGSGGFIGGSGATKPRWIYRPGVYNRVISQVYKGQTYTSNPQSITVFSPAYFDAGLSPSTSDAWGWGPSDGRRPLLSDACYWNNTQTVGTGRAFKFYRSVSLPAGSYTLKCCADDSIWVVLPNIDQTVINGTLNAVAQRSFTLSTTTTVLIDWSYLNYAGGTWQTNPGWFSIQIYNSGGAKVWGTKDATARGY
jgi:hypothetical protein